MQNGCARRAVAPSDNNITREGVWVQVWEGANMGDNAAGVAMWRLVVVRGNGVGTFRETSAGHGVGARG